MNDVKESPEKNPSEPEITREGRTLVKARDLLQDKAVQGFIREMSESIRNKKVQPPTDEGNTK